MLIYLLKSEFRPHQTLCVRSFCIKVYISLPEEVRCVLSVTGEL
nr:MAG TPA_asm: hypothetical protein [Caudoviricetes sp.]